MTSSSWGSTRSQAIPDTRRPECSRTVRPWSGSWRRSAPADRTRIEEHAWTRTNPSRRAPSTRLGASRIWRVLGDGACVHYRTGSLAESARLVEAIGELNGVDEHPPDLDVRPGGVTARLITITPDDGGLTGSDVEVALAISTAARGMGLAADLSALRHLLIVPGAPDVAAVMPFWRAVLGYVPRADSPDEDLVDPSGRSPGFWLEEMAEPRPGGGGAIHVAIWVPIEEAEARVDAALAAGGRIVRDTFAPSWWTLADAAGNEVDVATVAGRE